MNNNLRNSILDWLNQIIGAQAPILTLAPVTINGRYSNPYESTRTTIQNQIGSNIYLSFTRRTAREIRKRANTTGHEKSELSLEGPGRNHFECAHLNHKKETSFYDDPRNGMLIDVREHLSQHILFERHSELIGLNIHQNNQAINGIIDRIKRRASRLGLRLTRGQSIQTLRNEIEASLNQEKNLWKKFFVFMVLINKNELPQDLTDVDRILSIYEFDLDNPNFYAQVETLLNNPLLITNNLHIWHSYVNSRTIEQ